jgi:hypothetical protein
MPWERYAPQNIMSMTVPCAEWRVLSAPLQAESLKLQALVACNL